LAVAVSDIVYDFQWDAVKALSNADKHGVTFEQAATVFQDPLAVFDEAHSQDEERWWSLGQRCQLRPVAGGAYLPDYRLGQRQCALDFHPPGD
jgi:hypothetical protein